MGGVPSVEQSFLMSTISWRGEHYDGDNGGDGGDDILEDRRINVNNKSS